MREPENIAEVNKLKYISPPPYHLISQFIEELGVSNHHFEKFYGIPFNIIAQIKLGTKRLPPQYWHFVYERIVPTIGPGFVKYIQKNPPNTNLTKTITKPITNAESECSAFSSEHDRLVTVK